MNLLAQRRVPQPDVPPACGSVVGDSYEVAVCRPRHVSSGCLQRKGVGADAEGGGKGHVMHAWDVAIAEGSVRALLWQGKGKYVVFSVLGYSPSVGFRIHHIVL